MMYLAAETAADAPAREALLTAAFGEGRFRKTAEKLRAGRLAADGLAFSLKDGAGVLIGTLRLWNITAGSAGPALLLGPIAIAEHRRGQGLGEKLIGHGLAEAERLGHRAVLLVGDAPYYQRFGFTPALTEALRLPGPVERARFLGLELAEGALAGACGLVEAAGLPAAALPNAAAMSRRV